ncbi:hypothetical protein NDU88_006524 [Pleurodeles waltl]|uniref:Uncharacterized protein n=1 Tax=Pleurodeles waltl TaxID=8319 RepID=A0AAV7UQ93_PLEWA|nr:hypothetical protein NDU88_006524 [Pleurodeles waltl]
MDFSESLKISYVSKQTMEVSDKEESQQSETEQHAIRNDSLLFELDTVASSTTDHDLLFIPPVFPVSSSKVNEEQLFDLPMSDLDEQPATAMPPAVSLKLKTPENQHSETKVLENVPSPTKTKDLNLNLGFEDLMISTVLSGSLQETIMNSKARTENVDNNAKATSEGIPFLFFPEEQPFSGNRAEDQLPVVETLCQETISDTMNTPQSTCNAEIIILCEDHPKELACGTSKFSAVNTVYTYMKISVDPIIKNLKSSKTEEKSDFFVYLGNTS